MDCRPSKSAGAINRGFVLLTVGLMLVVLFAFLGLAMDVGYLQWTKRRMQVAADGAAVGGAQEVLRGAIGSQITSSAKGDSALNGFTDGANGLR